MFSVDLSTRDCDGYVVVGLRGELDLADAAAVAAALAVIIAREPEIIIDLAGLEFIDSSGVAALARGRKLARLAGGELRLAAPQPQAQQMLTLTRLIDVLPVHASVDGAAGHTPRAASPAVARSVPAHQGS
jgi:anti-sigma B factor antagonist